MAHRKEVYTYNNYIEYEYKFAGKYGARGEKRQPRRKASEDQIKKQNQRNKERLCIRIIRANFFPGDLWVTLKFRKGTRVTIKEIKAIRKNFFDRLRRLYKAIGQPLKYIYRIEIGELGGIHFHILINRLEGNTHTDLVIRELWEKYGSVDFAPTYEEGGFKNLAEYLVKPIPQEISGQLRLFGGEEEKRIFVQYNRSRNLIAPEPEVHVYKRRTVRKLIEEGPKPTEGYYIDWDSIVSGTNPYTGMSYLYYTEIKIEPISKERCWTGRRKKGSGGDPG